MWRYSQTFGILRFVCSKTKLLSKLSPQWVQKFANFFHTPSRDSKLTKTQIKPKIESNYGVWSPLCPYLRQLVLIRWEIIEIPFVKHSGYVSWRFYLKMASTQRGTIVEEIAQHMLPYTTFYSRSCWDGDFKIRVNVTSNTFTIGGHFDEIISSAICTSRQKRSHFSHDFVWFGYAPLENVMVGNRVGIPRNMERKSIEIFAKDLVQHSVTSINHFKMIIMSCVSSRMLACLRITEGNAWNICETILYRYSEFG